MFGFPQLEPFSEALSQAAVEASSESCSSDYLIEHLLTLSAYLIQFEKHSYLFVKAPVHDPYSPSLRTLYDRLNNRQLGPSLLPPELLTKAHIEARVHERSKAAMSDRPLADFEDLYYAVVACMKEVYQLLNDHVRSGFHGPQSPVTTGGATFTGLHHSLSEYWAVFNDPVCGKALDDAVRRARFEAIRREIVRQVGINQLSREDAERQLEQLWDLHSNAGLKGMQFINAGPPAMINVSLQTKYLALLTLEKQEDEKKAMQEKKQAKIKALKKVMFLDKPDERMYIEQRDDRMRTDAQQVNKEMRVEVNYQSYKYQYQQGQYPSRQQKPDHVQTPQELERECKLRKQRVSAYRNYLHSIASENARKAVRHTKSTFLSHAQKQRNSDANVSGSADC